MPKLIKIYLYIEYYIKDTIQLIKDIRKDTLDFERKIYKDHETKRNEKLKDYYGKRK